MDALGKIKHWGGNFLDFWKVRTQGNKTYVYERFDSMHRWKVKSFQKN